MDTAQLLGENGVFGASLLTSERSTGQFSATLESVKQILELIEAHIKIREPLCDM
jgi:hypothetical protein